MARKKNKSILVIPDLHIPYHHPDSFKFLAAVKKEFKCDRFVCLGDEISNDRISFHEKDPDTPFSPSDELDISIDQYSQLFDIFPKMDTVDSNHSSLVYRKQKHAGLPRRLFKEWRDILEAPKTYKWHRDLHIRMSNGQLLYIHHGTSKGKNAILTSQRMGCCYIQGHYHGQFHVQWWSNGIEWFWGVTSGCLVDITNPAFDFGKDYTLKPLLGCTVIIEGTPFLIPMRLNKNNKWSGSLT